MLCVLASGQLCFLGLNLNPVDEFYYNLIFVPLFVCLNMSMQKGHITNIEKNTKTNKLSWHTHIQVDHVMGVVVEQVKSNVVHIITSEYTET